ncbi:Malic enzyme [Parelaphostrongylus tenuis]|uniref:Malic enzyme n=1 Tax=Parelaphostrongylus tenuis TaxID=148309 RepID=A0AAD5RHC3_PARTN|nr:Malic enzyme [Parelaphostrongylus tenuis]
MLCQFGCQRFTASIRHIFTMTLAAMSRKNELNLDDPKKMALYNRYRMELVTPNKKGYDILKTAQINKGMAFTLRERQYLGIHGLLPPAFMTQEQQACRVMKQIRHETDNLEKFMILDELQGRTEKLFYRVLCENIKELMPIVYTPTVGLACQEFGEIYRRPN